VVVGGRRVREPERANHRGRGHDPRPRQEPRHICRGRKVRTHRGGDGDGCGPSAGSSTGCRSTARTA
jgi:hypothetical protein